MSTGFGFLVPKETPVIWRAPMVMGALQQMLSEVDWGELDIMVIDMPPGTRNAQLTMAQPVPLAPTKASTCSRTSLRRCSASSRT
jgi:Mrp family chromosome partitioning ATPase